MGDILGGRDLEILTVRWHFDQKTMEGIKRKLRRAIIKGTWFWNPITLRRYIKKFDRSGAGPQYIKGHNLNRHCLCKRLDNNGARWWAGLMCTFDTCCYDIYLANCGFKTPLGSNDVIGNGRQNIVKASRANQIMLTTNLYVTIWWVQSGFRMATFDRMYGVVIHIRTKNHNDVRCAF